MPEFDKKKKAQQNRQPTENCLTNCCSHVPRRHAAARPQGWDSLSGRCSIFEFAATPTWVFAVNY